MRAWLHLAVPIPIPIPIRPVTARSQRSRCSDTAPGGGLEGPGPGQEPGCSRCSAPSQRLWRAVALSPPRGAGTEAERPSRVLGYTVVINVGVAVGMILLPIKLQQLLLNTTLYGMTVSAV